jgi:hypothetical protein
LSRRSSGGPRVFADESADTITPRHASAEYRSPKTSIQWSSSRRTVPTHRSAWEFACGVRTGVLTTCTPSAVKTASNAGETLRPISHQESGRVRSRAKLDE